MQTEDLIRSLATDLRPVPAFALERRLVGGVLVGAVVAMILVIAGLGLRPDLAAAARGSTFWMKLGYTLSLGFGALIVTARLARPDTSRAAAAWWLLVPVLPLAGASVVELLGSPMASWSMIWMGHSWQICPVLILSLAVPIYLGLSWAFRRFAPSRLAATGTAAGTASGGLAAAIYCLHCPETSASFVLTWYSLGIGLAALGGRLAGPRLFRW